MEHGIAQAVQETDLEDRVIVAGAHRSQAEPCRAHPIPDLPPADLELSPHTGLGRLHWEHIADHLLVSLRPVASENCARITPPGPVSSSGVESDGLEGFARTFLLAAFRVAGAQGEDPHGHLELYRRGLEAGVDPEAPDRWVRPSTHGQAKVEAASIAIALDLTRAQTWDLLPRSTRDRLIDWFAEVIGSGYPPNNWAWFRIVTITFLRSVDHRFRTGELAAAASADLRDALALHESFVRDGGWFSDGANRSFDHYGTWAFALYPTVWTRMQGFTGLLEDGVVTAEDVQRSRERLAGFTADAVGLVGADGGPLLQGRSLIYRMATATPFGTAALAEAQQVALAEDRARLRPGVLRRAASGQLAHFMEHGVPDADGLLSVGWFHEFVPMAQTYSGSASPYWASKAFVSLLLPADHSFWTATEEPLPIEDPSAPRIEVLPAPGWIVSRTPDDGIVRVLNHGTDNGRAGLESMDSPAYARTGYSTATCPPLAGAALHPPHDRIVAEVHPEHGPSHRAGFTSLRVDVHRSGASDRTARVGVGITRQHCHWVDPDLDGHDHGAGFTGTVQGGATLIVAELVCDGQEISVVYAPEGTEHPVMLAGWPVAGSEDAAVALDAEGADGAEASPGAVVVGGAICSAITPVLGELVPIIHQEEGTSPLGPIVTIPQLRSDPLPAGAVIAARTVLAGSARCDRAPSPVQAPTPDVRHLGGGLVSVRWADGTCLDLALGQAPEA